MAARPVLRCCDMLARTLSFKPKLAKSLSFRPIKPERQPSSSGVLRVRIVNVASALSADAEVASSSVKISIGNEEEISFGADLSFRFGHFLGLLSSRLLKAQVWSEGVPLGRGELALKQYLSELESGEVVEANLELDVEHCSVTLALWWEADASESPKELPAPVPRESALLPPRSRQSPPPAPLRSRDRLFRHSRSRSL